MFKMLNILFGSIEIIFKGCPILLIFTTLKISLIDYWPKRKYSAEKCTNFPQPDSQDCTPSSCESLIRNYICVPEV